MFALALTVIAAVMLLLTNFFEKRKKPYPRLFKWITIAFGAWIVVYILATYGCHVPFA